MLLEIKKIPEGERNFNIALQIGGKNVEVSLKTERNRANISCLAKYETEIDCECSRCLENFRQKISGEVRFFIVYENDDFADDDFDCYRYKNENEKIDFAQTIHDDVFTQIPMKPLCKEDCKGIIFEEKHESAGDCGQWAVLKKMVKK
ncbi:MAG: DUF177 domain-containing protein [Chitinivibrionia bacterium]|nr:DUF177 domain-containing protein [Chitinivibrionia bacterium]